MLLYEVRLLHPQTREVIFESLGPRPNLPASELQQRFTGAILIINTRDSIPACKKLENFPQSKGRLKT